MELVSCIIPTYRKFEYLFSALDSIFEQDYNKIEIIISDDGSENIDRIKIENYILEHKGDNIIDYKILIHNENIGTVKNMNYAVEQSSGNIIIPLACDDIFYNKNVISRVVERFNNCNCQVLVCSRLKCSEDLKKIYRLMPHPNYIRYINKKMDTPQKQYHHIARGNNMEFASGSAMYYKRSFFNKVERYDEKYFLWEDGPFIAKITRLGYIIEKAYDIVAIYYRDGGISSKSNKNKKESKIANDYIFEIENEFLKYDYLFTRVERRILKGREALLKNYNMITLKLVILYPELFISLIQIKILKFWYYYFLFRK